MTAALLDRFFAPVPRSRVALVRLLVYLFVPFDMLLLTRSALSHAELSADLYQPVLLARLLHIPAPTPWTMRILCAVVITCALIAACGRATRIAGGIVAAGYLWWVVISMSYGKVDHDHLALIVALFVLPTAGRARVSDGSASEAAGWALRCVQIAVVATYFLSAWAKMRIGGTGWANGETLAWALERRGTPIGRLLIPYPAVLHVSQWITLVAEFGAPLLLFSPPRIRYPAVAFFAGFHATTYALMTIHFLPHAICLAAFLPLERLTADQETAPAPVRRALAAAGPVLARIRSGARRGLEPPVPGPAGAALATAGPGSAAGAADLPADPPAGPADLVGGTTDLAAGTGAATGVAVVDDTPPRSGDQEP